MTCPFCGGQLFVTRPDNEFLNKAVPVIKCSSCNRPVLSQLVNARAVERPDEGETDLRIIGQKLKKESEAMGIKCKTDGCEKFSVRKGLCSGCFEQEFGMKVSEAKKAAGGGHTMKPREKAPHEPAQAAPEAKRGGHGHIPSPPAGEGGVGAPGLSGSITLDISGWSLDKLIKLKTLLEA